MNRQQLQERIDRLSLDMAYIPYNSPKLQTVMAERDALEQQLFNLQQGSSPSPQQSAPSSYQSNPTSSPYTAPYASSHSSTFQSNFSAPNSNPTPPPSQEAPRSYRTHTPQVTPQPQSNTQPSNLPAYISGHFSPSPTSSNSNTSLSDTKRPLSQSMSPQQLGSAKSSNTSNFANTLNRRNTWVNSPQTESLPHPVSLPSRPTTIPVSLYEAINSPTPPSSPSKAPDSPQYPQTYQTRTQQTQAPPRPKLPAYLANLTSFSDLSVLESPSNTTEPSAPEAEECAPSEELLAREARVAARETALVTKEQQLLDRERELLEKAKELEKREEKLRQWEESIRAQKRNQIQVLRSSSSLELPRLTDYDAHQVTLCQRFVRGFLRKKQLIAGKVKPRSIVEVVHVVDHKDAKEYKEKKKNNYFWLSIREILKTEESYVEDLNVIISSYMEPMFSAGEVIKTTDVQSIFGNITTIYQISTEFLEILRRGFSQLDSWDAKLEVSLGHLVEKLPLYAPYYVNFDYSNALRQKLKNSSRYSSFLESLQAASPTPNYDLDTYLIKPCQRLPRYKILLEAVIKQMPQTHKFRPLYESIMLRIQAAVTYANEEKRNDENRQKVGAIATKITGCPNNFTLEEPHRLYRFHAPLGILSPKSLKYSWKTGRIGYLFNDILMVTRSRSFLSNQLVIGIVNLMDNIILEELEDTPELWNCFTIQQGDTKFYFIADTVESKQTWLSQIRDTIKEVNNSPQ